MKHNLPLLVSFRGKNSISKEFFLMEKKDLSFKLPYFLTILKGFSEFVSQMGYNEFRIVELMDPNTVPPVVRIRSKAEKDFNSFFFGQIRAILIGQIANELSFYDFIHTCFGRSFMSKGGLKTTP